MKKLSFLLLLSVFLASCGQEVAPQTPPPVSPVKTEVSAPVIEVQNRATVEKDVTTTSRGIIESNSWDNHKTMDIVVDGVIFQIPWDFGVSYDIKDTLVSIWGIKRDGMNLFGLIVYEEKTIFTSYEDYLQDLKNNFIKKLIKENNKDFSESDINNELKKLEGHFFIESKEINGIKVVIHKRDFYGMIGKIYDMYVFIWNGKVLHFSSETDYQEILDQIYSSIKFQNSINKPISFSDAQIQDILAKIDANTKAQQEIAKNATRVLVQGDFRAEYMTPKDYSKDTDKIVVTISWVKYELSGAYWKERMQKYLDAIKKWWCGGPVGIEDAKKVGAVLVDGKYYALPSSWDCWMIGGDFGNFIEFSPSWYYLLYKTHGYEWSKSILVEVKTGKVALEFSGDISSWTTDKKQFIFSTNPNNIPIGWGLFITKKWSLSENVLIQGEKIAEWLYVDQKYIYVRNNDSYLRIYDLTTLKEVFSKEIK
jgi:hypothetical protein